MNEPNYLKTRAEVNSHMRQAQAHLNRDQKGECIRELIKTIDVLCNFNKEISQYLINGDFIKRDDLYGGYVAGFFDTRYRRIGT